MTGNEQQPSRYPKIPGNFGPQVPDYKPGDVVNGHVLSDRNEWIPFAAATASGVNAPRARAGKGWVIGVLTVIALFVGVPALGAAMESSGGDAADVEDALGADAPLSEHDLQTVENLGRYPKEWNAAADPLVRDYIDPNVSAEDWVEDSSTHIEAMRAAVMGMDRQVMTIQDQGLRQTFTVLVENYQRKFEAIVALWNAVANQDAAAESQAVEELDAAVTEGRTLAASLLDHLLPYMTEEDIERAFPSD